MAHVLEMAMLEKSQLPLQEVVKEDCRKYPFYKARDNIEAFLQNFEQICLDYKLPLE